MKNKLPSEDTPKQQRYARIVGAAIGRVKVQEWIQITIILLLLALTVYTLVRGVNAEMCVQLYIDGQPAGLVRSPAVVEEASGRIALDNDADAKALNRLSLTYSFAPMQSGIELLDSDECFVLLTGYIDHNYTVAYALVNEDTVVACLSDRKEAESVLERLSIMFKELILNSDEDVDDILMDGSCEIEQIVCERSEVLGEEQVYEMLSARLEQMIAEDKEQDKSENDSVTDNEILDGRYNAFVNDNTFLCGDFHSVDVLRNPTVNSSLSDELQSMLEGIQQFYRTIKTEKGNEYIPYQTLYVEDPDKFVSYSAVTVEGINGLSEISYEVTYLAGVEVSRKEMDRVVISEPVDCVITVGTKPYPKPIPTGTYIWPLPSNSIITSYYGNRPDPITGVPSYHTGMDLYQPKNTPIHAMDGGEVTFAGLFGNYGLMVEITHSNGVSTIYGHMNEIDVEEGELVYQGQQIGKVGNTGRVTGYHLHLEVKVYGVRKDPLKYLP